MKLSKRIEKYANEFTTHKRGEETIIVFNNESKELHDAVFNAHGDKLPNDQIFDTFHSILETLTGYDIDSMDDVEEYRHEIVDGLVDIYTYDLTSWLNNDISNTYYLDQAIQEYEAKENILPVAQYIAIDEIYSEVLNLLEKN